MPSFRAVRPPAQNGGRAAVETLTEEELGPGEVDLAISHSAISRDDASAALLSRGTPSGIIPGSDLAGVVLRSSVPAWHVGDRVIATGYDLGRTHPGGWAERALLPAAWLLPQPNGMSPLEAVAIGSAGLAAMTAALAIELHGVPPESGFIVSTGATGGVGSLSILALRGPDYTVTAATGRPDFAEYLLALGAEQVVERPLLRTRRSCPEPWAAAIDCLGGDPLAALVQGVKRSGAIAVIGDVAGDRMSGRLTPLIRRQAALFGIDAITTSRSRRIEAWQRWGEHLNDGGLAGSLSLLTTVTDLDHAVENAHALLAGARRGRIVIDMGEGGAETRLNGIKAA